MPDSDVLTAADIARLAGVTRATVSNWRRRHTDFPASAGGTAASPAYARTAVEAWLAGRGALPELSPEERLWRSVREASEDDGDLAGLVTWAADLLAATGQPGPSDPAVRSRSPQLSRELAETARTWGWQHTLDVLINRYTDAIGARPSVTPLPVAEVMTALADPGESDVVFDPAVGTGNLLFSARKYRVARFLGQDLDVTLAGLTLRRHAGEFGPAETVLRSGDSLRDDQFAGVLADVVVCHTPFGSPDWGFDELAGDARWEYGTPARAEGELAWVQHALAHLHPGGRAIVLMPPAAASRPSGRRIRAELVRRGALRGVMSLPSGVVEPRHIPVHIWVLERPASRGSADPHMLFIDAAAPGAAWKSVADDVVKTWAAFRAGGGSAGEEPGRWRVVPAIDLLDETVDVTPARHVGVVSHGWSPAQTRAEIQDLRVRLHEALLALGTDLPGDDWDMKEETPHWRKAAIADLGRWEAVTFYRASSAAPGDLDMIEDLEKSGRRPVLRADDVLYGERPSAAVPNMPVKPGWVVIQQGDVIVPANASDQIRARVAAEIDEGAILGRGLHLIRPDPERMDSWFLSGFLSSPVNVRRAGSGSTGSRIDVRRLAVPVLPLADQRRYGAAFRELRSLEEATRQFASLAERFSRLLGDDLAAGRLEPRTETFEIVQTSDHSRQVHAEERP